MKETRICLFLLFLVFFVLKVTGFLAWSWWWVTAPLWGPLAVSALAACFALLMEGILYLTETPDQRKFRKARESIEAYQRSLRR